MKGSEWQKLTAVLKAPFTDVRSRLRVVLQTEGTVDMDHISLFPVNTWKKRENGLRADWYKPSMTSIPEYSVFPAVYHRRQQPCHPLSMEEFRGSGREPSFERKSLELYIQA